MGKAGFKYRILWNFYSKTKQKIKFFDQKNIFKVIFVDHIYALYICIWVHKIGGMQPTLPVR